MDTRTEVQDAEITAAFALLGEELKKRLVQKGKKSFISTHEILGASEEEMHELREAVQSDSLKNVTEELLDLGVGALFGVASLIANERAERAEKKV